MNVIQYKLSDPNRPNYCLMDSQNRSQPNLDSSLLGPQLDDNSIFIDEVSKVRFDAPVNQKYYPNNRYFESKLVFQYDDMFIHSDSKFQYPSKVTQTKFGREDYKSTGRKMSDSSSRMCGGKPSSIPSLLISQFNLGKQQMINCFIADHFGKGDNVSRGPPRHRDDNFRRQGGDFKKQRYPEEEVKVNRRWQVPEREQRNSFYGTVAQTQQRDYKREAVPPKSNSNYGVGIERNMDQQEAKKVMSINQKCTMAKQEEQSCFENAQYGINLSQEDASYIAELPEQVDCPSEILKHLDHEVRSMIYEKPQEQSEKQSEKSLEEQLQRDDTVISGIDAPDQSQSISVQKNPQNLAFPLKKLSALIQSAEGVPFSTVNIKVTFEKAMEIKIIGIKLASIGYDLPLSSLTSQNLSGEEQVFVGQLKKYLSIVDARHTLLGNHGNQLTDTQEIQWHFANLRNCGEYAQKNVPISIELIELRCVCGRRSEVIIDEHFRGNYMCRKCARQVDCRITVMVKP